MCTQVSSLSLMPRIHLPVLTDRSPISSKTGSGRERDVGAEVLGDACGRRGPGRPLIIIPQLPQMPARQTKSNCSDGSCFSRISESAMKSVMPGASSSS